MKMMFGGLGTDGAAAAPKSRGAGTEPRTSRHGSSARAARIVSMRIVRQHPGPNGIDPSWGCTIAHDIGFNLIQ